MFDFLEQLATFPETWQEVRQVHISKPGQRRPGDRAVPVSKLRPIAVLNIFWRIYIAARLQTMEAQQWYQDQLIPEQDGCVKKKDAASAVIGVAEDQAKGRYLCSLDLKQAFDTVRSDRALQTLVFFHLGSQPRWVEFGNTRAGTPHGCASGFQHTSIKGTLSAHGVSTLCWPLQVGPFANNSRGPNKFFIWMTSLFQVQGLVNSSKFGWHGRSARRNLACKKADTKLRFSLGP